MRLGIFAKTFPGNNPGTVFKPIREAGFTDVQYNLACSGLAAMPDEIPAIAVSEVAIAAQKNRIAVAAVSGTYNMIHPDLVTRRAGHTRLRVLAASCKDMGTNLITLCTGTRDPNDQWREHPDNESKEAWSDLLASMNTAIDCAEKYNVYLGIEPELANVVNSAEKARKLIDELQSDRLKIILDPANLFEMESLEEQRRIVSDSIELLADRIVMGHAKDRHLDGRFTTAGKGVLDYPHYLKQLQKVGFTGPLVTHGLSDHEAADVAEFLRSLFRTLSIPLDQ